MFNKAFLDLDGTVYVGQQVIDGVDVELRRLAHAGVKFYYMTNNSSLSREHYAIKIDSLQLPLFEDSIVTPFAALSDFLRSFPQKKRIYAVCTDSFTEELGASGLCLLDDLTPDLILVGFDRELTYSKLEKACTFINAGVPYYLTNIDLACPSPDGPIPDCGAIGAMLERATGVSPVDHFGKPGKHLASHIQALVRDGDKCIVAGDRLYTDAALGRVLGFPTILVRTGEFKGGQGDVGTEICIVETLAGYLRQF